MYRSHGEELKQLITHAFHKYMKFNNVIQFKVRKDLNHLSDFRSSYKECMADALVIDADEGRGKLR